MAADHSLPLRRGVVDALRADAWVNGALGQRVYGPQPPPSPTWPFARVQIVLATPLKASRLDGSDIRFSVHGFTKGDSDPEAEAAGLGALFATALDGKIIPIDGLGPAASLAHIDWLANQTIPDGDEAGAWHVISEFTARFVGSA